MTRPDSSSLKTLRRLTKVLLIIGALIWAVAVGFIRSESDRLFGPNLEALQSAMGWAGIGGSLFGFGMLALVGYLMAAAIGDFIGGARPQTATPTEVSTEQSFGTDEGV